MSTTPRFPRRKNSHRRSWRKSTAACLALGLTSIALPVALAPPAAAATTHGRCTVQPLDPVVLQSGKKLNFPIRVFCEAGRTIELDQSLWEHDSGPHDPRGGLQRKRTFDTTATVVIDNIVDAFNSESGSEEVFHTVRFRTSRGQAENWNAWTAPENSKVVTLPQSQTGTTHGRCTVKPLAPAILEQNTKLRFPVEVFCEAGRTIELKQSFWEQDKDPANNDPRGQYVHKHTFDSTSSIVLARVLDAFNSESGPEEVFQSVQFRTSRGQAANWTGWSASEDSPMVILPQD